MKSVIKTLKFSLSALIVLSISCVTYAASPTKELLYKKVSFNHLEEFTSQYEKRDMNSAANQHGNNIINIFLTAQLQEHPEYVQEIIKKFDRFSPSMKVMYANALIAIEGNEVLKKLHYTLPKQEKLLSIKDVDQISLSTLKKQKGPESLPQNTDYLWAAFEATGKDKYLINILSYLASEPLIVRALAFEMINRDMLSKVMQSLAEKGDSKVTAHHLDYSDIKEGIEDLAKKDPSYSFEGLLSYRTVLWSMQSQRNQHPEIEAKLQHILKQNPKLDYRKDVKLGKK